MDRPLAPAWRYDLRELHAGLVLYISSHVSLPLRGAAGMLDWWNDGIVTELLAGGGFTGRSGELVLLYAERNDFRMMLAGIGDAAVSAGHPVVERIAGTVRSIGVSDVLVLAPEQVEPYLDGIIDVLRSATRCSIDRWHPGQECKKYV